MNTIPLVVGVLNLIVGLMLIVAILRIFRIDATLLKILKAIETADKRRQGEANELIDALAGESEVVEA